MAKNGSDRLLHIAMLPWLAFGHMIPFLEQAKLLATKGHRISFISTPRNIDRLPRIPQTLTPFIDFVKINLPKVDNLPEKAESTKDVPFDMVPYLKIAFDKLQQPITCFLKTSSPDWIFCDFASYWLMPIAAEYGVLTAYFSVFPAVFLGFLGEPDVLMYGDPDRATPEEFVKKPKWVSFESDIQPALFHLTRTQKKVEVKDAVEHVKGGYRFGVTIQKCDVVIVRSSLEFEPDWLNLLNKLYKKPVIPAGLLPARCVADDNTSLQETREWLDKHKKGSVVYIAFGSETKPSQYELTQLANGLELCGLPFYWVLINQRGPSDEVIHLPNGFEQQTRGRGVVCTSWAPQFNIISHDSICGLLIHSGMSSLVEGLQLGKPLVLLPLLFDQSLIASYLVEKKMAYMVPRDKVDGKFEPESVAESLNLVMVKEEGKKYRDKAKDMMSLFDTKIQNKCLDELIDFLQKSM